MNKPLTQESNDNSILSKTTYTAVEKGFREL